MATCRRWAAGQDERVELVICRVQGSVHRYTATDRTVHMTIVGRIIITI